MDHAKTHDQPAIAEALVQAGFPHVQVEVDDDGTVYVSGDLASSDEAAQVVALAFRMGAERVREGLGWPDRPETHIERRHVVGSYRTEHSHPDDPARRILEGADLSERVFDSPEHGVRTGTPLVIQDE